MHQVIVISHAEKEVPSSEAHKRIRTSPHYSTRAQRAEQHLKTLLNALEAKNWQDAIKFVGANFKIYIYSFQAVRHLLLYDSKE